MCYANSEKETTAVIGQEMEFVTVEAKSDILWKTTKEVG